MKSLYCCKSQSFDILVAITLEFNMGYDDFSTDTGILWQYKLCATLIKIECKMWSLSCSQEIVDGRTKSGHYITGEQINEGV